MNFLNNIRTAFSGKKNTDTFTQPIYINDDFSEKWYNLITGNKKEHEYFVSPNNNEYEIYRTTPEVMQVIDKGTSLFQNGSWILKNFDNEIIENHPVLDLLKKPNALMSKNEFLKIIYLHWALNGNSFSYLNYAFKGATLPSAIMPLPYNLIKLIRSKKYIKQQNVRDIIEKYILINPEDKRKILDEFEVNEILHVKNLNPKDFLIGKSKLESLHMPISNIREGYGYVNADYAKKGALGMLSPEGQKDNAGALPVLPHVIKEIEKNLSEYEYGIADNKNKLLIMKTPSKYQPFSSALASHLILETRETNFKRIIDAYGLSHSLFSFLSQTTFSNQENGEKQSYQNGIIPFANSFSSEINDKLKLFDFKLKVELDYSHVSCFQEDEKTKVETLLKKIEIYKRLTELGWSEDEAKNISTLV